MLTCLLVLEPKILQEIFTVFIVHSYSDRFLGAYETNSKCEHQQHTHVIKGKEQQECCTRPHLGKERKRHAEKP